MPSKDERNEPPVGWEWEDEWTIDTNRAVDEQGHHRSEKSLSLH